MQNPISWLSSCEFTEGQSLPPSKPAIPCIMEGWWTKVPYVHRWAQVQLFSKYNLYFLIFADTLKLLIRKTETFMKIWYYFCLYFTEYLDFSTSNADFPNILLTLHYFSIFVSILLVIYLHVVFLYFFIYNYMYCVIFSRP